MLLRNRITLVTSLGIGLISMLLFGALFGSGGSDQLRLGIVDEDRQAASIQLVEGLKGLEALDIVEGERDAELQALAAGDRTGGACDRCRLSGELGGERCHHSGRSTTRVTR